MRTLEAFLVDLADGVSGPSLPCSGRQDIYFAGVGWTGIAARREAKALCASCPQLGRCRARVEMLERSVGRQRGTWAGLSRGERARLWPASDEPRWSLPVAG